MLGAQNTWPLRLIEARRLLIADGTGISQVTYSVGYESVPQLTRDDGSLFGIPPGRDIKAAKANIQVAA